MDLYKTDFIEFMVRCKVLTFGDFVTKSGRKTPFFINTGNYNTGPQLEKLGQYYAEALINNMGEGGFDVLYGPAYKGIPLAAAASIALSARHSRGVGFCFNRKEAKDHGERGVVIGHKLREGDRVVIIEDVVTAGTSVRESVPIISGNTGAKVVGLVVSVDRMERGTGNKSALDELRDEFGIRAFSIVTIDEIVSCLHNKEVDGAVVLDDDIYNRIGEYREKYGCSR
jgi:orotate phosphoribosyltransferase